jgi:hypothetical protein
VTRSGRGKFNIGTEYLGNKFFVFYTWNIPGAEPGSVKNIFKNPGKYMVSTLENAWAQVSSYLGPGMFLPGKVPGPRYYTT